MEKLKAHKLEIIALGISFASIFLSMFFLNLSGFNLGLFLLFDLYSMKDIFFSPMLWLFVIFFSIGNSIFIYLFHSKRNNISLALSVLSSASALFCSFFIFPNLRQLVFIVPFYVIGLALCKEIFLARNNELKRFKNIRAASTALGKMFLVLSIGLFFCGFMAVTPEKEKYAERFEQTFLKSFMKLVLGSVSDAVVEEKRGLVREIIDSNEFRAMEIVNNEANKEFSRYMRNLAQDIHSQKYRKDAIKEVERVIESKDFLEKASDHMPLKKFTRSMSHIILPFNAAFIFWVFAQLFIILPCALLSTLFIKISWE
ncbi:MAG: hypothetical protein N3F05_04530 [Candidatus Diapherotrites archaeon]|nr:hypothetical protein [Candidatus Diapherotrites archaeon]